MCSDGPPLGLYWEFIHTLLQGTTGKHGYPVVLLSSGVFASVAARSSLMMISTSQVRPQTPVVRSRAPCIIVIAGPTATSQKLALNSAHYYDVVPAGSQPCGGGALNQPDFIYPFLSIGWVSLCYPGYRTGKSFKTSFS